jgi:hypothetical protein
MWGNWFYLHLNQGFWDEAKRNWIFKVQVNLLQGKSELYSGHDFFAKFWDFLKKNVAAKFFKDRLKGLE